MSSITDTLQWSVQSRSIDLEHLKLERVSIELPVMKKFLHAEIKGGKLILYFLIFDMDQKSEEVDLKLLPPVKSILNAIDEEKFITIYDRHNIGSYMLLSLQPV